MPTKPATTIQSTTQQFLEIYDITNDLAIMKDGATALIISVDAMNFGLLAEEEQDAVMYAYAGLLNSLNYPIQIVIRSQTKDATNYLNLLKEQENNTANEKKRQFISDYRDFVSNLIKERNVLDKKFYIAIPASSLEMGLLPPSTVIPGVKKIDISTVERSVILDKAKTILEPKRDHLISQFGRIGLYARQLQTQEIIQLFYTSYNPEAAEGQQITDTRDYVTTVVDAQVATEEQYPVANSGTIIGQSSIPNNLPTTPAAASTLNAVPDLEPAAPLDDSLANSRDIYVHPPAVTEIPVSADLNPIFKPPVSAATATEEPATQVFPTQPAPLAQPQSQPVNPAEAVAEISQPDHLEPAAAPITYQEPVSAPAAYPEPVAATPAPVTQFTQPPPTNDPTTSLPPIAEIH